MHYLVSNYSNLGKIETVKTLRHDNINSINFLVQTSSRKYVLRNFTDESTPQKIEKVCHILNFGLKNKIKVAQPIKFKKNYYVDKKNRIFLTKFYPGKIFSGDQKEFLDLAKQLALLHKVLNKNKTSFRYSIKSTYQTLTEAELKKINIQIKKQPSKDSSDKLILTNMEFLKELIHSNSKITKNILKKNFGMQLIHSDLHIKNVIFNKKKVSVLLDFNSMRNGYKMNDIAFTGFRFASFNTNKLNLIQMNIKKFVDEYTLYNNVNQNQLEYFSGFLQNNILGRLSYIIRKRYLEKSNLWIKDLKKHLNSLKLITLMENV